MKEKLHVGETDECDGVVDQDYVWGLGRLEGHIMGVCG